MTTLTNNVHPAHEEILHRIRAQAIWPAQSTDDLLDIADRQAQLLRDLLPASVERLPARLAEVMPELVITYADDIPWSDTSFRRGEHWHIHVRATDPADVQALTVLHELKSIIDRSLHHDVTNARGGKRTALAQRFALQVLLRRRQGGEGVTHD
jgi:hypothetical protein